MALPTSGSISIAQIAAEMGVSLPLDITSTAVRNFIGKPTGNVVIPNDFWGKSAVSYYVSGGFSTLSAGGMMVYEQGTFTVFKTPSSAPNPTAYQWFYNDYGGMLMPVGGSTGSSYTLRGPNYDGFGVDNTVEVWCRITVGGVQSNTAVLVGTYKAGIF